MIIKILLVSCVIIVAIWFLINRGRAHARAGIKLITSAFAITAVAVILFPDSSNSIANAIGVGRGADLVLYFMVIFFCFFALSYYIRSYEDHKKTVVLTRKIAIIEANELDHNK